MLGRQNAMTTHLIHAYACVNLFFSVGQRVETIARQTKGWPEWSEIGWAGVAVRNKSAVCVRCILPCPRNGSARPSGSRCRILTGTSSRPWFLATGPWLRARHVPTGWRLPNYCTPSRRACRDDDVGMFTRDGRDGQPGKDVDCRRRRSFIAATRDIQVIRAEHFAARKEGATSGSPRSSSRRWVSLSIDTLTAEPTMYLASWKTGT